MAIDFKGTPGPLHVVPPGDDFDEPRVLDYDGHCIAFFRFSKEGEANATLFANALRLAEALDALVARIVEETPGMAKSSILMAEMTEARAALDAAMGRT